MAKQVPVDTWREGEREGESKGEKNCFNRCLSQIGFRGSFKKCRDLAPSQVT